MNLDFYDSNGNAIAYSDDAEHVFTFSGTAAGYLHAGSIYSFAGNHLGRFEDGFIRDNEGFVVFFSQGSIGGPVKPMRKSKPLKSPKQLKPLKGMRRARPAKPQDALSWSTLSGDQFFG